MEGLIIDPGALRQFYRDNTTTLSNNVLYRKITDESAITESNHIYLEGWEIRDKEVRLYYKRLYWTHEAYLAKSTS